MIRKSTYVGAILLLLVSVISCEKDFQDIGTSVVNNAVFETKIDSFDIEITPIDITAVQADGGISVNLGEYLLGVYNGADLKTIEASIVSQVGYISNLTVVDNTYDSNDTIVVTKMDTVFIRIPYQSTNIGNNDDGSIEYRLDSILGNPTTAVPVKVYRNLSFLNTLDPYNPTQSNTYQSNENYIEGALLSDPAFTFTVPQNTETLDTMYVFNRHLNDGTTFKDTLKITNSAPFFTIPLHKEEIKSIFLDKYQEPEFETANAFENYFRGLIIKASGDDGALIPFNFTTGAPTLEIYYTNTVLANGTVIDTIQKNNSFNLTGVRNSKYIGSNPVTPANGRFVIQGTAGTMANITILSNDTDGDGISDLDELKALDPENGVLINDASLIFYIDKTKDTTYVPNQLFLFKNGDNNPSQILDSYNGYGTFGGNLLLDDNNAKDRYHFRITDYVTDLVNGESNYNPPLGLRVFNSTDTPTSSTDTIVKSYNWNPRGITLYSNTATNQTKKAKLKIAYSIKK